MIVSTIAWKLLGILAIGLAAMLIVAVMAFLVTRMGDDKDGPFACTACSLATDDIVETSWTGS